MYDYDMGKIKFIQEHDNSKVEHVISGDSSLDEVIDAFEHFLKGAGYHLPDGCHIGYEYDEDESTYQSMQEDVAGSSSTVDTITITSDYPSYTVNFSDDNTTHSSYYWDKDRNK